MWFDDCLRLPRRCERKCRLLTTKQRARQDSSRAKWCQTTCHLESLRASKFIERWVGIHIPSGCGATMAHHPQTCHDTIQPGVIGCERPGSM